MVGVIQLIVAADEPALFFRSVEAAQEALEAIDVRDGVYTAVYGSEGQVYEINAVENTVLISQTDAEARPEELRALLLHFLRSVDVKPVDESLAALLHLCEPFLRR